MAQNKRSKGYKRQQSRSFDKAGGMILMACAIMMLVCAVLTFISEMYVYTAVCVVLIIVFIGVAQYFNGNYRKRK